MFCQGPLRKIHRQLMFAKPVLNRLPSSVSDMKPPPKMARAALLFWTTSNTISNLRIRAAVVTLLAATLVAPPSLRAKETRGTVRGFVYDAATGVPLPQVRVEMIGEVTIAATTTNKGAFAVEGVPVGTYRVSYSGANWEPVSVEAVAVIAGEVADASVGMSKRVKASGTSSVASESASDAPRALASAPGGPQRTNAVSAGSFDLRDRLVALNLNNSETLASAESAIGIDSTASDDRGGQQGQGSALVRRGRVRLGRDGLRFESRDGAFKSEVHLRSQIRFSSPFASVPRQRKHFLRDNENDLRFRRARLKSSGHLFRPWVQYSTEYDLVGTRMLDLRVTVQKWEWLQFRFGQWKTEFGRERVSSSGRQEFVERSIVNRQFTVDRQKGFMIMGRVNKGTWADSRYYAGVFTGNGRGFRSSGAGSLDNRDGSPMWVTRYQWNFLKDDPGFSQSDLEYHKAPVAAIAIGTMSNRSRFTRFSGSGGGSLDGYEVGLPGQFAVKQVAEDFVLKYRGLFLQHEFHRKNVRDRIFHRITRSTGTYFQGGYFPHYVAPWVPEPLELGLRYATVDQDRARRFDRIVETAFVVNWFMEGHGNKLTFDIARYRLAQPNGTQQSAVQARVQWDVSF